MSSTQVVMDFFARSSFQLTELILQIFYVIIFINLWSGSTDRISARTNTTALGQMTVPIHQPVLISGSITHNIPHTVQVDGSYEGLDLHDGRPLTEREEHRTQLVARDVAVPVLVEQHERLTQLCKS